LHLLAIIVAYEFRANYFSTSAPANRVDALPRSFVFSTMFSLMRSRVAASGTKPIAVVANDLIVALEDEVASIRDANTSVRLLMLLSLPRTKSGMKTLPALVSP
jgi:hypothetical protein